MNIHTEGYETSNMFVCVGQEKNVKSVCVTQVPLPTNMSLRKNMYCHWDIEVG